MELTASPTSTSRDSTMPSMGLVMVEFCRSVSARSSAAWARATSARFTATLLCAARCWFSAIS